MISFDYNNEYHSLASKPHCLNQNHYFWKHFI